MMLPQWLTEILDRVMLNSLARGESPREARQRARNRYELELRNANLPNLPKELTASRAYQLYQRIQRRIDLAEQLTEDGGSVPRPQNVPHCPELNNGEPAYHATVYLNFEQADGTPTSRQPVQITFGEALDIEGMIDLAIGEAQTALIGNDSVMSESLNSTVGRMSLPTTDGATVGDICYG